MTRSDITELATVYDHLAPLVAEYWCDDLHYGYWDGSDDHADFRAATDRLTRLVVPRLRVGPGDRVLDVGCGHGRPAAMVAATTGASVVGIDLNPRALAAAEGHADRSGVGDLVDFALADALNPPCPEGSFDAALAFESTPHFQLAELYPALQRVLRPGGLLVVETPYTRYPLDDSARRRAAGFLEMVGATAIHSLDDHLSAWRDSGFEPVEFLDITPHVHPSFGRLAEVLRSGRDDLVLRYGEAEADRTIAIFADWATVTEVGGALLTARRR